MEVAKYVTETESENYVFVTKKIIDQLLTNHYSFNVDEDSIVRDCSEKYHNDALVPEVDLIYGDYFLIETLSKLTGSTFNMWN